MPQLKYDAGVSVFQQGVAGIYGPMARAATQAVKIVGQRAQADVKAAVFQTRTWQNGIRLRLTPSDGSVSIDASARISTIPLLNFAGVFQVGSRISGKPLLWLPLPDIPDQIGGRPMTPKLFVQSIGPLRSGRGTTKPLLFAQIAGQSATKVGKKTVAKFRNASRGGPKVQWVPVFVGVSAVQLKRMWNTDAIFKAAQDSLEDEYINQLAGLI